MRVPTHQLLLNDDQRDMFLSLLKEHGVRSKPKKVMDGNFPFVEFQLPIKWKEHELTRFLDALEQLVTRP